MLLQFSRRAEADLLEIGEYTLKTWGTSQANRYLMELERCCNRVAKNASLGRACHEIRPGLHRIEQGSHVIFYREEGSAVLILRILHKGMLPELRTIE